MYQMQLEWIRGIQETLSAPWIEGFFRAWDYVDSSYFIFPVIALVWYLWDRRIGIRLFYVLALSFTVNTLLKSFFDLPRPCQLDPSVGILCTKTLGFPSGGAQSAAIYFGLILIETKRTLYRVLALIFALTLCFSRIYLGLHFFTDVLGGLVVGGLLVLVYWKIFPLFEKWWRSFAVAFSFLHLFLGIGLSLPAKWTFYAFLSTLGVACGLILEDKIGLQKAKNFRVKCLNAACVLGGIVALFIAQKYLPNLKFPLDFVRGFWLSFLGAYLVQKARIKN